MKRKSLLLFIISCSLILIIGCNDITSKEIEEDDALKLQKKSEHFILYSHKSDKKCLDELIRNLESNYERITSDLGHKPQKRIRVNIYPDIETFHIAISNPNAADWVVGSVIGDEIYMVSPLNPGKCHNYDSIMKVITHEFTHVITAQINSSLCYSQIWLSEGIALYEAKQMDEISQEFIQKKVNENMIPSFSQLNSNKFAELGGYQFSYTIIEYIIKNYGYEEMRKIIKSPDLIEKILGISKSQLEQDWIGYLHENYKK